MADLLKDGTEFGIAALLTTKQRRDGSVGRETRILAAQPKKRGSISITVK
jgi:hypothetical protein